MNKIKYTAKQLTAYAEKIGFVEPKVWYSKMDGWWLDSQKTEEYLGADSAGAKNKLTALCEGIYHIPKRGGAREGAGRKHGKETVVKTYRCYPEEVPAIKAAIKKEIVKLRKGKPKPPPSDYA